MMMYILLLLIAVVGVYADFQVNGKMTFIAIVAVIAVLGAFVLPELTARRFIKKDKSFIGHTMRYVFYDNGINVLDEQFAVVADSTLRKDAPVALYCRSGKRSKKAAAILSKKGYTVYELDKGFTGWKQAGKETEK